jgi:hypothetical protein
MSFNDKYLQPTRNCPLNGNGPAVRLDSSVLTI